MDKEVDFLVALRTGNKQAFSSLYHQYRALLESYASSIIGTRAAEDIVQDCFLYIYEHKESISSNSTIKAFLYSIVYSRCIDYLRKSDTVERYSIFIQKGNSNHEDSTSEEKNALDNLYKKDFYKHLNHLMKQMSALRKDIFFMYINGMKTKEIAQQTQIPIRTVESHIYLAVKFLKKNMSRNHFPSL